MLNERKERVVSFTDSRAIFDKIKVNLNHMSFEEASKLMNDLAFVIVPFDRTTSEF